MDKVLVFDTGPIISLASNNLLWILPELKEKFGGRFVITPKVKEELIDKPLKSKKFRFEAVQLLPLLANGVIEVYESKGATSLSTELLNLANTSYEAKNNWIKIVHPAEIEVLCAALELHAQAVVIDETATRYLIEDPSKLLNRLERKLHSKMILNKEHLNSLKIHFKNLKVIRSFELAIVAYDAGLFSKYLNEDSKKYDPNLKHDLLSGVLWALKLNGCSVKTEDIEDAVSLESKR
ncbi:hypothetical protein JXM83_05910 [Candidatus Woesearchaeota archaeon]|nr:hypothetical protein [Candidatus Woesearchaeota archaeon]